MNPDALAELEERAKIRLSNANAMGTTIAGYCWEAETIEDYRVAPFHILAAEGARIQ